MKVKLEIEMNEIEEVISMCVYNNIMWRFTKPNKLRLTHFREIYDDVNDWPMYHFGIIENDKFMCLATGEGDQINDEKLGFGGCFVSINIYDPETLCNNR